MVRNSSGDASTIFQGTSSLARYSWSKQTVSGLTLHELQNTLRLDEGGIFLYLDPYNSFAPELPLVFGSTWTQGGLFSTSLNLLPVQLFGCYGGRQYNLYVRPFLVDNTLSYNGADYTYDAWSSSTSPPLLVRPDPLSDATVTALTSFQGPTASQSIIPAQFQFYTPVMASGFTYDRAKSDSRVSVNFGYQDAYTINLTLTEVPVNTIYPTINTFTSPV